MALNPDFTSSPFFPPSSDHFVFISSALDAESLGGDECMEEDEEELETSLEDPESGGKFIPVGRGCCILTRRGITLRVLLKDGLIEPGEGVLSIYYLVREVSFLLLLIPMCTLQIKITSLKDAGWHRFWPAYP